MYLLLLGALGIAALGSLMSSDDDEEFDTGEDIPDLPITDGDDSSEEITGTDGAEIIRGFEGRDTIDGGAGDDWIYAGTGDDSVIADAGDDRVFLGSGDDVYGAPGSGIDEGNDWIEGGSGDDTITVNGGNHEVWGDDSDDDEEGDDLLTAEGGQVTLRGGDGDDTLAANDGGSGDPSVVDVLYGGDGDDELTLGAGDTGDGGDGDDRFVMDAELESAARIVDWNRDNDEIVVSYVGSPDNPPEVDVVQSGADAHLVVDGRVVAVLQDTDADEVGNIDLVARASSAGQPA
ncbi:calcium-binding protein [Paracoccus niistensis]|uniref:Calcium-binding protein n=2 Tax=Paracoccus niistensis TaxID=632935 RepID=A0ABV6I3N9_9RHOB